MKKTLSVFILHIFIGFSVFAQTNSYSEEYGKVTQNEMLMTQYAPDEEAEAVVIYEVGNNYFTADNYSGGFLLRMKKQTKIKILNKAGLKYANIEVFYYKEGGLSEDIDELAATVYNWEDGVLKKTELNSKDIFEEKLSDNYYVKKIALSDVREGSVIEYKYRISTPFFFNMRKWEFQKKIPVIHSKLNYRAIPYYEYSFILKGSDSFDAFDSKVDNTVINVGGLSYKEMVYNFEKKNIPAFRDDDFISSPKNYLVALDFQVSRIIYSTGGSKDYISTWPALSDSFLKDQNFGKYIKDSEKEGKKTLPTLGLDGKNTLEQAQIISDYVKKMYAWNGYQNELVGVKLSDFLKQKVGNVANLNLFLVGLLKAANIEVYPVVLSTRDHGLISKQFPFQQFLNYVIAEVIIDGKKYFVDVTEPLLPFGDLPERCVYSDGLVIKPKSEEWVFTETLDLNNCVEKIFDIKVLPETNRLDLNIKYIANGQNAFYYRETYAKDEENIKSFLRKRNNIVVDDQIIIEDKDNAPFSFSFNWHSALESNNDKLFIHPFSNISISDNPFKKNTRSLPIDLVYLRSEKYKSTIEIPEGYTVEFLPKQINHESRIMLINYSTKVVGNKIEIEAGYSLNNNIYEAKDYMRLKSSYDEMIKQFSEMVVLKKN